MRRAGAATGLLLCALVALWVAGPAAAATPSGPCAEAAKASMPEGAGHDHTDIAQHRFACRVKQVAFLSLKEELKARPDVVLGEMDVKEDIAVVAVAFPEAGFLLFDVADPAKPKFLSWYRTSECEQTIVDVDCGAYVDLSSDAKTVFLSIQNLTILPGARPAPGVKPTSFPGVEVVDVSDPRKPSLTQTYPVVSQGGVHTSRSHVIPDKPIGNGPRAAGEYLFAIANGVGIDVSRVDRGSGKARLTQVNTIFLEDEHDTFLQNDPVTNRTYMYVAGGLGYGFVVYDVTDPAQVQRVAKWDLTPHCTEDWYGHTVDVTHRGEKRYVTLPAELFNQGEQNADDQAEGCGKVLGNGDKPGPLWIVDASDFAELGQDTDDEQALRKKSEDTLVATWENAAGRAGGNLLFSSHNQQIVGDRIYLSQYHAGVAVLDASAAFAGRRERPADIGFVVPSGAETRPIFKPTLPPLMPFFITAYGARPTIWDQFFYKGHILAADEVGGFYSFQFKGDVPPVRLSARLQFGRSRTREGRTCARASVLFSVAGKDRRQIRLVSFFAGKRKLATDRRRPFAGLIRRRQLRAGAVNVLRARVTLKDGRRKTLTRRVRVC